MRIIHALNAVLGDESRTPGVDDIALSREKLKELASAVLSKPLGYDSQKARSTLEKIIGPKTKKSGRMKGPENDTYGYELQTDIASCVPRIISALESILGELSLGVLAAGFVFADEEPKAADGGRPPTSVGVQALDVATLYIELQQKESLLSSVVDPAPSVELPVAKQTRSKKGKNKASPSAETALQLQMEIETLKERISGEGQRSDSDAETEKDFEELDKLIPSAKRALDLYAGLDIILDVSTLDAVILIRSKAPSESSMKIFGPQRKVITSKVEVAKDLGRKLSESGVLYGAERCLRELLSVLASEVSGSPQTRASIVSLKNSLQSARPYKKSKSTATASASSSSPQVPGHLRSSRRTGSVKGVPTSAVSVPPSTFSVPPSAPRAPGSAPSESASVPAGSPALSLVLLADTAIASPEANDSFWAEKVKKKLETTQPVPGPSTARSTVSFTSSNLRTALAVGDGMCTLIFFSIPN